MRFSPILHGLNVDAHRMLPKRSLNAHVMLTWAESGVVSRSFSLREMPGLSGRFGVAELTGAMSRNEQNQSLPSRSVPTVRLGKPQSGIEGIFVV